MGLSLEFYAGDAERIGSAFAEVAFDRIRDGSDAIAYADLSLHVPLEALDVLSNVIAERLSREPLLLLDSLGRTVGQIDDDGGTAYEVAPVWVATVAALSLGDARSIADEWIRRVGEEEGEELEPSEDATRAIGSLIELCKTAVAKGVDVVHVWYL